MCFLLLLSRASGHVDRFADFMVKDMKTGECFRADHLLGGRSTHYIGPVHKGTNYVPKAVSERIRTLSWLESLILPFVNAKLFQIRLLKCEKRGVLDRDSRRKPVSETCERKALSECDSCVRTLEMRTEGWSHAWVIQRGLRSRNARSSNHDTNHEADRDPKWLSERDLFHCEQAHCVLSLSVALFFKDILCWI